MEKTEASIGKIISLQKMVDPRGNLSIAEGMKDIPFNISRVYWTYDVPSGACRGGHTINIAENSSLPLAVPSRLPSIMGVISNLSS